jgi:hypothetical protein
MDDERLALLVEHLAASRAMAVASCLSSLPSYLCLRVMEATFAWLCLRRTVRRSEAYYLRARSTMRKEPKASVRTRNPSSRVSMVDPRGRGRWRSSLSTQRRALTWANDNRFYPGLDVHEHNATSWCSTCTTTIDLLHIQIQEAGEAVVGGEHLLLIQGQAKEGEE